MGLSRYDVGCFVHSRWLGTDIPLSGEKDLVDFRPNEDLELGWHNYFLKVYDVNGNYSLMQAPFDIRLPGGGGDGCFLTGTPILLADGTTEAIEKLQVGQTIMAYDEVTGEFKPERIKEVFIFPEQEGGYYVINERIKVTEQHRFYIRKVTSAPVLQSPGEWVEAGQLKIGDMMLNAQGKPEAITSIKHKDGTVAVYNLEVNPYHTFIAGGVVVRNAQKTPKGIAK